MSQIVYTMTLLECAQAPQYDAKHTHGIKRMAHGPWKWIVFVCSREKKKKNRQNTRSVARWCVYNL